MARNLGSSECYFCGTEPDLLEPARPIEYPEARGHFGEFRGMLVARARCGTCLAEYLAWMDEIPHRHNTTRWKDGVQDLAFRSTFRDDPGVADLPLRPEWMDEPYVRFFREHSFREWAEVTERRAGEAGLTEALAHVLASWVLES